MRDAVTLSGAMGRSESKTLRVAVNLVGADAGTQAIAAARGFAAAAALPDAVGHRLCVIVEELVLNLYEHGGVDAAACVELVLARRGAEVSLVLEDPGHFFDPRAAEGPSELPPERGGGAGIALVQAWSRVLAYDASGGVNRLELLIPVGEGDDLSSAA